MQLPQQVTIAALEQLLQGEVRLSAADLRRIRHNRDYLDKKLATGQTYYGINTGFGALCNVRIDDDQLRKLQQNLVTSHSCGLGEEVPAEIVRLMLLLKIRGLALGFSGIHPDTLERLLFFYNQNILPIVFQQGSLGASGDLAPLAHLSLPLLGMGEVLCQNQKMDSLAALQSYNLLPLDLHPKEGLALLNGTQFMSAYAAWGIMQAQRLSRWADVIATLSLEAFDGKQEPFLPAVHRVRPHPGQIATAEAVCSLLDGSALQSQQKSQVQDPYSLRCVPQVHGATKDALRHAQEVVEIEINAVTDNPIVFEEEDMILSGGNFHGQPLALQLDFLAIAMAELANISERRTYLLIGGQRGLPSFLATNPGLHSGFMIAQYTAASIVSQNKQYCTPASVDSIVSSNGQEDHVSMGANAATKLKRVLDNVQRVLAIELLCAAQALHFRGVEKTSEPLQKLVQKLNEVVPFNEADHVLHYDLVRAERFLDQKADDVLAL
ncbi:MAG: histidine ammonia-lyase [Edaphocola sp.]